MAAFYGNLNWGVRRQICVGVGAISIRMAAQRVSGATNNSIGAMLNRCSMS